MADEHTIPRKVLRTYMQGAGDVRLAYGAAWIEGLHDALRGDEGYRWLRKLAGGTWHDLDTFVPDEKCSATFWFGPGHQSHTTCEDTQYDHLEVNGVRVHNAWVMNGEYFWTKQESYDAWDSEEEAFERKDDA